MPLEPDTRYGASIWFVKNNVVVYVSADGQSPDRLQFARDVARKIEAKIEAVLPQK